MSHSLYSPAQCVLEPIRCAGVWAGNCCAELGVGVGSMRADLSFLGSLRLFFSFSSSPFLCFLLTICTLRL